MAERISTADWNVKRLEEMIELDFRVDMFVDSLPVLVERFDTRKGTIYLDRGIPVGLVSQTDFPTQHYYTNHYRFFVHYHVTGNETISHESQLKGDSVVNIVGVTVVPMTSLMDPCSSSITKPVLLSELPKKVLYSYEVIWVSVCVRVLRVCVCV